MQELFSESANVVWVLGTGGTISGRSPDPNDVLGYTAGEVSVHDLLGDVPVPEGVRPYEWDEVTGIARRFVPGQPGGEHTLTGLAHNRKSGVAYNLKLNKEGVRHRSLKLAALQKTLKPPTVNGDDEGEMLVVGWGSTRGAIEEAVQRVRADGFRVSSMHLRILQPMASGIREILQRFDKVLVVENNWADSFEDELIDEENRRYSNLAWLLRARCLVDVDCYGEVGEQPIKPGTVERVIRERLGR